MVSACVHHPLADTFRHGRDDLLPLEFAQEWEILRVSFRDVTVLTKSRDGGMITAVISANIAVSPDAISSTGTAARVLTSVLSSSSVLRGTSEFTLRGMDGMSSLVIGMPSVEGDTPPSGSRYAAGSSGSFIAELGDNIDTDSGVLFDVQHTHAALPNQWNADDISFFSPQSGHQVLLTGTYSSDDAAVSSFVSALEREGSMVMSRSPHHPPGMELHRRTTVDVILAGDAALPLAEAALVVQRSINLYAHILEQGTRATPSSYVVAGAYGDRLSLALDSIEGSSLTAVTLLFGQDKRRGHAAAVFGFPDDVDVVVGTAGVIAPLPFLASRASRPVLVFCDEFASHVGGAGDADGTWFKYGPYHETSQLAPARTMILPTGSYGEIRFSPPIDISVMHIRMQVTEASGRGDEHITSVTNNVVQSLLLEALVSPF